MTELWDTRRRSPVASFPRPWHDVSLPSVEVADVYHRQAEEIEGAMKITGIILVLIGTLWMLQGLGIVGGSFMTGQSQWLYIGIVTAIAGVALLAWAARRPPAL